jgi:type IV pilus assembly protein PilV
MMNSFKLPTIHHAPNQKQRGLTLIEVLVAVVVISIGLLGVAALHLTSLRNSFDANIRSRAALLADDIADRMRANPTAAGNDAYLVAMGSVPTGTTQAELDIQRWKTDVGLLPNGDGSITSATVGGITLYTITIQWQERDHSGESPDDTTTTFATQTGI